MNVPHSTEKQTTSPTLDQETLDYLRREGEAVSYTEGASIMHQGDPGKTFYAILRGSVEIGLVRQDGQELPLRIQGEGAFFGEMWVLWTLLRDQESLG